MSSEPGHDEIRRNIRAARRAVSQQARAEWSGEQCRRVAELSSFQQAEQVAILLSALSTKPVEGFFAKLVAGLEEKTGQTIAIEKYNGVDIYVMDTESDTKAAIKNMDINAPSDDETETPNNEVLTSATLTKSG